MTWLEALWLGVVQGLTEFLPVSSSGHLVILESLLGIQTPGVLFEVALHVATLLSVLIFYRQRIAELVLGACAGRSEARRYVGKLAVGTVPAVAAVLVAGDLLEAQFDVPAVVGVSLLVTGAALWTTRRTAPTAHEPEPSWAAAALIGCAQAVALLPGISRSGSTVAVALALGVAPVRAAEFSFLLGVLAVSGAAARELSRVTAVSPELYGALTVGGAAALLSGVAAIWLFVRLLRAGSLHRFAFYVWALGAVYLLWLSVGGR